MKTEKLTWITPKLHVTVVKEFTNGTNTTDLDKTNTSGTQTQNKGKDG